MSRVFQAILLCVWLAAGHIGMAAGQTSVPALNPQVQADLLNRQIVEAYRTANNRQVLSLIDEYRALRDKGIAVPPALLLVEAKAAASVQDSERALRALGDYLNAANRNDPGYQEALALYPRYQEADAQRVQRERRNPSAAIVVQAIKVDDIATLKLFLEAGWNPAQALQPDADTKALGLDATAPIYPIEVAFRMNALSSASLLAPLSDTRNLSLQGPDGKPAWSWLPWLVDERKWTLKNPEHRENIVALLKAILRSNTPRVTAKGSVVSSVYRLPLTSSDRLQLFRDGLLTAQDVSGRAGAEALESVARNFGFLANTSETDATAELRTLIELGADVSSIGNTAESLAVFLGGPRCDEAGSCGEYLSLLDPRAAKILLGSGWAPQARDVDAFWKLALLSKRDVWLGRCVIDTYMPQLMITITFIGNGFEEPAATAADAIALVGAPQLRPSQDTIKKLRASINRYSRGYVGKDKCRGTCQPASETWCGALANSLETRS